VKATKTPHDWSKDALLNKSLRYAEKMLEQERDSWLFGFWSALTLEMLVKAAISNVSPALIAEKEWKNTYFALGYKHPEGKPKTAAISDLLNRAEIILPGFNRDMQNFCTTHVERRNAEIHSGALPFEGLSSSAWLAEFYLTCEFLLKTLKKSSSFLFGKEEAKTAKVLIKALRDDDAKIVQKKIAKHKKLWGSKIKTERERLAKQASIIASRDLGHRVKCPACGSDAVVKGAPSGLPNVSTNDQTVVVKTPTLPSRFSCSACRLKVVGYSKLNACGLGGVYTSTVEHDAIDYYGVREEDQWMEMEEDNNEP
jgi:hypothetical protein